MMGNMTLEEWKQQLLHEKFRELWVHKDPPGREYEAHSHPVDTAHVVLKGDMIILVEDKEQTVREGERFDIPKHVSHVAKIGPEGCEFLIGVKM